MYVLIRWHVYVRVKLASHQISARSICLTLRNKVDYSWLMHLSAYALDGQLESKGTSKGVDLIRSMHVNAVGAAQYLLNRNTYQL